jgi:hypothetical protein
VAAPTRWLVDLGRLHATLAEISRAEEDISDEIVGLLRQIYSLLQSILSHQSV